MIITEKIYGIKCDICGRIHDNMLWEDMDMVIKDATEDNWLVTDTDEHYCHECKLKLIT